MRDALLVLGLRLNPDGSAQPGLEKRVQTAAALFHEKDDSLVVMSGGDAANVGITEAEVMADLAREYGVPSDDLREEPYSLETPGNFAHVGKLFGDELEKIIVITDTGHVRRSSTTAEYIMDPKHELEFIGIDEDLSDEEKAEKEKTELKFLEIHKDLFFSGIDPGDYDAFIKRLLEKSFMYEGRPEYNDQRAEYGLPLVS